MHTLLCVYLQDIPKAARVVKNHFCGIKADRSLRVQFGIGTACFFLSPGPCTPRRSHCASKCQQKDSTTRVRTLSLIVQDELRCILDHPTTQDGPNMESTPISKGLQREGWSLRPCSKKTVSLDLPGILIPSKYHTHAIRTAFQAECLPKAVRKVTIEE